MDAGLLEANDRSLLWKFGDGVLKAGQFLFFIRVKDVSLGNRISVADPSCV
jgi:hypothetical protein